MDPHPFVCNMTELNEAQRARHHLIARELLLSVQELRELPDGYALRLPTDSSFILLAAEFITLERLCCPFFNFELQVEGAGGATWLCLSGEEGIKPFIREEFGFNEV